MAERVGFEPTVEFPLHTLSKRAPSTTRTSLRIFRINELRAVAIRIMQNGPLRIFNLASPVIPTGCGDASKSLNANCDKAPNVLRSIAGLSLQAQGVDQR